jgi:hypothetical protein
VKAARRATLPDPSPDSGRSALYKMENRERKKCNLFFEKKIQKKELKMTKI